MIITIVKSKKMDEVKTFIENYDRDSVVSDCSYILVNDDEPFELMVSKLEEISKIEITSILNDESEYSPCIEFKLKNSNKTGVVYTVYDSRSNLYWFVEIVA